MKKFNLSEVITLVVFLINLIWSCADKKPEEGVYYCPMHPQIISTSPGTCPICNMTLVKSNSNHEHYHENEQEVKNIIQLDLKKQKWIGLETSKVIKRDFTKKLLFAGNVAYDPELYIALIEYKAIVKQGNLDGLTNNHISSVAYNRLLQMGLSKDGIKFHLQRDPEELITGAESGSAVVYVQIYEAEISTIKPNMKVKLTSSTYPAKEFSRYIKALDTILNPDTRTMKARILVRDPDSLLKPQMLVEAETYIELKNVLAIPNDSILHTGQRTIVYKKIDSEQFEAVEVLIGKEAEDYTEVVKGLKENDEVVTKANFLLDSESKLKHKIKGH